ncbi:MAG: hypothetical protein VW378_00470 [bacterium]
MKTVLSMPTHQISVLLKYCLSQEKDPLLTHALTQHGILSPLHIAIYKETPLLIDGFKRLYWAQQQNMTKVPACTHPCQTPKELFQLIHALKSKQIQNPIIQALLLQTLGREHSPLLTQETHPLSSNTQNLETSSQKKSYFHNLKKLSQLSPNILHFCREKKFSFTHCKKIITFKKSTLEQLIALNPQLQWTASNFILAASYIEQSKQHTVSITDELKDILTNNPQLASQNKRLQNAFLEKLKMNAKPTLHYYHKEIKRQIHALNLPKNIDLIWDKSLETHALTLQIHTHKKNMLSDTLNSVNTTQLTKIDRLLDML